jgi:F0F1-type ATP synthase assembly protein I
MTPSARRFSIAVKWIAGVLLMAALGSVVGQLIGWTPWPFGW